MKRDKEWHYNRLKKRIEACTLCELKNKRCYTGTGPLSATIMIVGQAPSLHRHSDIHFSGYSRVVFAKLLDALNITYDSVWITNAVKCIEPLHKHGDPKHCRYWLKEEIDIVKPTEIVLLGKVACFALFKQYLPDGSFVWSGDGRVYHILQHPMNVVRGSTRERRRFELASKLLRDYRTNHQLDTQEGPSES